jgi:hypothetical protein
MRGPLTNCRECPEIPRQPELRCGTWHKADEFTTQMSRRTKCFGLRSIEMPLRGAQLSAGANLGHNEFQGMS